MTTTEKQIPREKRTQLWIIATALSLLVYGALVTLSLFQPWALWLAMAVAVVGVGFGVLWVVSLDEAAQHAHYVSWYWGGSLGLGFAALILLAMTPHMLRPGGLTPAFDVLPGMNVAPTLGFMAGYMLGVLPPVLGYLIWWGVISLRRG